MVAALRLLAMTTVRVSFATANGRSSTGTRRSGPTARMMLRWPHRIPLALDVLKLLHALAGKWKLLFHSMRSLKHCTSENTINAALRRVGYGKDEMTGHGSRSASTFTAIGRMATRRISLNIWTMITRPFPELTSGAWRAVKLSREQSLRATIRMRPGGITW
ncbi:MAG: hypothetical protein ACK4MV_05675 [Beijerinckiaceae bacterium]